MSHSKDPSRPAHLPISAGTVASRGLRRQLIGSHLTVAAIGIGMLLITLGLALSLRSANLRLATVLAPTETASSRTLLGVKQARAALSGWTALEDEGFRVERRTAWNDVIHPRVAELQRLSRSWADPQDNRRLQELLGIIHDLEEWQWWIEDIVHTPGNQPATVVFQRQARPVGNMLRAAIVSMIGLEKHRHEDKERKPLLGSFGNFKESFDDARAAVSEFLVTGADYDAARIKERIDAAAGHLAGIDRDADLLTIEQHDVYRFLEERFAVYRDVVNEVIDLRRDFRHGIAHQWLAQHAFPLVERIDGLLTAMSENQAHVIRQDAGRVTRISNIVTWATFGLIATLCISAAVASLRGAARIMKPIRSLAAATGELSAGRLLQDIPVEGPSEIADLTCVFNRMRANLQQSQEQLKQSEARTRGIVETAVDGIILIDDHGIIQSLNSSAEKLFGVSRDEAIGHNVSMLMPAPQRHEHDEYIRHYLETGERRVIGTGRDVVGQRKDGTTFPMHLSVGQMRLGDSIFFAGITRDITELVRAQEQLGSYPEQLRKQNHALERSNADLVDFAHIASHDLKEPLRGIGSYATFLLEDHPELLRDDVKGRLNTIVGLTNRMTTLIETLLYYSRVGRQDLAVQDTCIRGVLDEVVDSLVVRLEDLDIDLRLVGPFPNVRCDRVRITEVFRNLITNAMKYNDKADKWIEVGSRHHGNGHSGKRVVFYVRDNGIGIPQKHIDTVFRMFKRLHGPEHFGGGTGAGLAFVKRIVERHGGEVWIESHVGVGTTFQFTLEAMDSRI